MESIINIREGAIYNTTVLEDLGWNFIEQIREIHMFRKDYILAIAVQCPLAQDQQGNDIILEGEQRLFEITDIH